MGSGQRQALKEVPAVAVEMVPPVSHNHQKQPVTHFADFLEWERPQTD